MNYSVVHADESHPIPGWEKDYLADLDALAFLTDQLYLFG